MTEATAFVPDQAPPPQVVATVGNDLVLNTGERLFDAGGGAIVTNIGHGRREVAEVAAAALSEIDYVIPPWSTPHREALRDRIITSWLPAGLDRVAFFSGGSESVDAAIRLARAHHVSAGRDERSIVIGRHPSYHGVTLTTLAAGSHGARRAGYEPMLAPFRHAPWDDADALETLIEEIGPEKVAAFVAEPVIGSAGAALVAPPDYFTRVQEICQRHQVVLIIDEVMTGFGRCGTPMAITQWDITPDIVIAGKGLSGGYAPIGGMYASRELLQPLADKSHNYMFFTFGAQSSSCAVSDKVLQIMEEEDLVARAASMGAGLRERLEVLADGHPHIVDVRGLGLLQGFELVADAERGTSFDRDVGFATRVVEEAMTRGAWIYPAGAGDPVQDAILLGPPYTVTDGELDRLMDIIDVSVRATAARYR